MALRGIFGFLIKKMLWRNLEEIFTAHGIFSPAKEATPIAIMTVCLTPEVSDFQLLEKSSGSRSRWLSLTLEPPLLWQPPELR